MKLTNISGKFLFIGSKEVTALMRHTGPDEFRRTTGISLEVGEAIVLNDAFASLKVIQDLVTASKVTVTELDEDPGSPVTQAELNIVYDWIRDHDLAFIFTGGPYAGTAGGAAVAVTLELQNGLGIANPVNTADRQVTVTASGSATIAESMPISFVEGKATINVSDAVVEGITLSLVDSETTGLDVTDTIGVTFS